MSQGTMAAVSGLLACNCCCAAQPSLPRSGCSHPFPLPHPLSDQWLPHVQALLQDPVQAARQV
jgi:hypothetical protein